MTHEELMEAIKDKFNFHTGKHDAEIVNALYKVVELHKPSEAWGDTHCGFCFDLAWEPSGLEMMDKHFAYPCPTIKAIEKELK
jgi:hypothetical protein